MKYLALLLLLSACGQSFIPDPQKATVHSTYETEGGNRYHVITIDGCEYIEYSIYGGAAVIHKGNCSNMKHYITK